MLTSEQALQCCKSDLWGASLLLLSECMLVWLNNTLEISRTGDEQLSFSLFPAPDRELSCSGGNLERSSDGIMTRYSITLSRKNVKVGVRNLAVDSQEAKSLMVPQEKLKDDVFKAGEAVEITLPSDAFDGVNDLFLNRLRNISMIADRSLLWWRDDFLISIREILKS